MEEVRLAVASNLIRLRTDAGMTQAELGEKLNYSDKTISKWERAEAIPDVLVLKQIGEMFHVSVDFLLGVHNQWKKPQQEGRDAGRAYSSKAVTMLSVAVIWTAAVLAFVICWLLGMMLPSIFAYAVPVSLITYLVLNSLWHNKKDNLYIVAALVLSIIAVIYIALIQYNPWQLFLVVIPAEVVVYLGFRVKKRKRER